MSETLRAEGTTGQIEVSNGVISITRQGLRASLSQGKKGELTIPVSQVASVDYKKPSALLNGHIHFILNGEIEHGSLNCPRTVIFRKHEEDFTKIAELVNRLKDEMPRDSKPESDVQKVGVMDDLVCTKCGTLVQNDANFCVACGAPAIRKNVQKETAPVRVEAYWTERCPMCQSGSLEEGSGILGVKHFTCDYCGAMFQAMDPKHTKYALVNAKNKALPGWKEYRGKARTAEEWTRVSNRGVYDATQREADIEAWMTQLRDGKVAIRIGIEDETSSVLLKENEELQMVLPNIALWEARRVTTSTGGYGGPSFRVAKGVSLRVGAFSSRSSSHDQLTEIDRGRLTVTDQRLVFTGAKRSSEIQLAKIISIEPYSDGIAVEVSGREKTQCFVGIDPTRILTRVAVNERTYSEPFSGLMLKCMIEGLVRRQGETGRPLSRKPPEHRVSAEQDIPDQIRELGKLRDSGLITAEEFDRKKKELLDRI